MLLRCHLPTVRNTFHATVHTSLGKHNQDFASFATWPALQDHSMWLATRSNRDKKMAAARLSPIVHFAVHPQICKRRQVVWVKIENFRGAQSLTVSLSSLQSLSRTRDPSVTNKLNYDETMHIQFHKVLEKTTIYRISWINPSNCLVKSEAAIKDFERNMNILHLKSV